MLRRHREGTEYAGAHGPVPVTWESHGQVEVDLDRDAKPNKNQVEFSIHPRRREGRSLSKNRECRIKGLKMSRYCAKHKMWGADAAQALDVD